jgi:hypothetical protein
MPPFIKNKQNPRKTKFQQICTVIVIIGRCLCCIFGKMNQAPCDLYMGLGVK